MFTCYIIDDDSFSIKSLKEYIERIPELTFLGSNTNPIKALKELNRGLSPDIILLDIEMPELSGLTVVDLLPKNCAVIFVTGHLKYALDGYEKEIIDFLFRPVSFERFNKGILKAIKFLEGVSNDHILINAGIKGKVLQLNTKEIIFIEALDHLMHIHTISETIKANISMKELEGKLPQGNFMRIHKSFIINSKLLRLVQATQIVMVNERQLPIGKKYRPSVLAKFKAIS